jgi:hypothetical protein
MGGWLMPRPGRFTAGKEIRHPLHRRLGGSQGRRGRVRKTSPPTGIRSPDSAARSESPDRLRYPGPPYTRSLSRGLKRPGRGVDHPPISSAEVKETVELYLYSWSVLGRISPLPFIFRLSNQKQCSSGEQNPHEA